MTETLQFDLLRCYEGWVAAQTPDNMVIKVEVNSESMEVYMSLRELSEILSRVENEIGGETMVGTGSIIDIEFNNDKDIVFSCVGVGSTTVHRTELVCKLRALFSEAVDEHDCFGTNNKEEMVDVVRSVLKERGLPPLDEESFY